MLSFLGYILGVPSAFIFGNSFSVATMEQSPTPNTVEHRPANDVHQKHDKATEIKLPYRLELGRRHRELRERYLKLSRSEMADFYGLKSAFELAKYEDGEREFQTGALDRAIEFFFLNPKFLEEGVFPVFRKFNLYSNEPMELLKLGFRPYLLCFSEKRKYLLVYVLLQKMENGYARTIIGDPIGSFVSDGGGRTAIEQIIYAMMNLDLKPEGVPAFKTNEEVWNTIIQGTFYCTEKFEQWGWGFADLECDAIFNQWYLEVKQRLQAKNKKSKIDS